MNILTYINMMFNINEKIDIITKSCNNLFIINVNNDNCDIIIYCYIFFKNNKVNIKIITNFKCYCYIDTNIDNEYINCINEFNISCIFN